jgi:hypothetical protein
LIDEKAKVVFGFSGFSGYFGSDINFAHAFDSRMAVGLS